jgi:hypothetical protein
MGRFARRRLVRRWRWVVGDRAITGSAVSAPDGPLRSSHQAQSYCGPRKPLRLIGAVGCRNGAVGPGQPALRRLAVDEPIRLVREAAGERSAQLELNALVQRVVARDIEAAKALCPPRSCGTSGWGAGKASRWSR